MKKILEGRKRNAQKEDIKLIFITARVRKERRIAAAKRNIEYTHIYIGRSNCKPVSRE